MLELTTILEEATRRLPEPYFQIPIAGGDPVYRERAYCYELYHQLRCLWPEGTDYYLTGELDKAAHPILTQLRAGGKKPDLLVHRLGRMENYAIIEVKSSAAQREDDIEKDLQTLSQFKTKVKYQRAIYLLFGHEADAIGRRVRQIAQSVQGLPLMELWLHMGAGQPATHDPLFPPTASDA